MNVDKVRLILRHLETELSELKVELALESSPVRPLDQFLSSQCYEAPGEMISYSDFCQRFSVWLEARGIGPAGLGKMTIKKMLPRKYPYGIRHSNQRYIGNISWEPAASPDAVPFVAIGGKLRKAKRANCE